MPRRLPPALALLPLRAFLGITFVYAGVQKLSDPGFLQPGAATYIGTQLRGFAEGTPGGWLLRTFALPHPGVAGVGVAVVEIAVGLLVVLGLATRAAALAGLALSLVLFLTASWKTRPYFLGSDIVFVFAWVPLALAGAQGQPALDGWLARRPATARPGDAAGGLSRRSALAGALGLAGLAALATSGLSLLVRGAGAGNARVSAGGGAGGGAGATAGGPGPAGEAPGLPAGAVRIGSARALGRGEALGYDDPTDGNPAVVVRQRDGSLTAFSAVCTHAGCAVAPGQGQLVCPCHGSTFDPRTGAVRQGPATEPLPRRRVAQRGAALYAVPD